MSDLPPIFAEDPSLGRALVVLTAAQYMGLLIFAGLGFFERVVRRRSQPLTGMPGAVAAAAGATALLASAGLVPITALRLAGRPMASIGDLSMWLPAVYPPTLVAAITIAAGGLTAAVAARGPATPLRQTMLAIGITLAVCAPVLTGHSRTREPVWLMATADVIHLAAGSIWVGGIIGLLIVVSPRRARPSTGTASDAARVVARFSGYAALSVILLAASGVLMTVLIIDAPLAIIESDYGRTLLLKIGLILALVAIAAWNRTRLVPRILDRGDNGWHTLRRTLLYEAMVILVVLAVTGALTNGSPSHAH